MARIRQIDYSKREHNYTGKVIYQISYTYLLFHILRPFVIQIIILAITYVIAKY
jgi:hypothetical protein